MNWNDPDEFTHRFERNEDGSPIEPWVDVDESLEDLTLEDCGDSIEVDDQPLCLVRCNLIINAKSCGEMMDSVKLHEKTCPVCFKPELERNGRRVTGVIPEAA
jgi:hypothetical protein